MPSMPAKPFGLVSTDVLEALGAVLADEAGGEHRRVVGERRVARRRRRRRRPGSLRAKLSKALLHAAPGTSCRPAPGCSGCAGRPTGRSRAACTLSRVTPLCRERRPRCAGTTSPVSGTKQRIDLRRDARDRRRLGAHVGVVRLVGLDRHDAPARRRDGAAERRLHHRAIGIRRQQRREGFSALARRIGDDAVHVVGGKEAQEIDARAGDAASEEKATTGTPACRACRRDRRHLVGEDRPEDDLRALLQRGADGGLRAGRRALACRRRRSGCRRSENRASRARRRCGRRVAVSPPLPPAERGSSSATRTLPVPITSPRGRAAVGRAASEAEIAEIQAGAGSQ